MWSSLIETFNIRWRWSIWKSPITTHPTLSSNGSQIEEEMVDITITIIIEIDYRRQHYNWKTSTGLE